MPNLRAQLQAMAVLITIVGGLAAPAPPRLLADDTGPIPASIALSRLQSLQGQTVELILQMADGSFHPQFARVRLADDRRVVLDRRLRSLPGDQQSLVARFFEHHLERPFPQTDDDRKLVRRCIAVSELTLDGNALRDGPRLYVVLSLKPIPFQQPEVSSALGYQAVKLDSKTDPWQSKTGGGPSAWVIRFGPPETPDRFEFRLPNPSHYPYPRIDSVVIRDAPEWWYDGTRKEYFPAVVFTVRHVGQKPLQGYFALDEEGFPRSGQYRLYRIVDRNMQQEILKLRESALISRRAFAASRPGISRETAARAPQRLLRYQFHERNQYEVITERTSTVSGLVSDSKVSIHKSVSEYLAVTVESVDAAGVAKVEVRPTRYAMTLETLANEEIVQSESWGSLTDQPASSPVLKHFQIRCRSQLGQRFSYSIGRRGLIRAAGAAEPGDDFLVFRNTQCGFVGRWLPLLPEESFAADGGWKEQYRLTGSQAVDASWWGDSTATGPDQRESAFRGEGLISPIGERPQATPASFTSTLRLGADDLLPASLELVISEAPLPRSTRMRDARHRAVEKLSWTRLSRSQSTLAVRKSSQTSAMSNQK